MVKSSKHPSEGKLAEANYMASLVEDLPKGWKVEIKTRMNGARAGKKDKCYIAPVTSQRFYSKVEVSRYLASRSKPKKRTLRKSEEIHVTNEWRDTVDGLPPGWTMELRVRRKQNKIRSDWYYTDPVTGYVFRSKKDVLRYLETGELGVYAFKPKELVSKSVKETDMKTGPSSTGKKEKVNDNLGNNEVVNDVATLKTSAILESSMMEGGKNMESLRLDPLDWSKRRKKVVLKNKLLPNWPICVSPSENQLVENGAERGNRLTQLVARKCKNKLEVDTLSRVSNNAKLALVMAGSNETSNCAGEYALGKPQPSYDIHGKVEVEKQVVEKGESPRVFPFEADSCLVDPEAFVTSDPCLDFAYKTLTGAIPVEYSLAAHQVDLQHKVSCCETKNRNEVSDFDIDAFRAYMALPMSAFESPASPKESGKEK